MDKVLQQYRKSILTFSDCNLPLQTLGYLGPTGSYCEDAAQKYLDGEKSTMQPFPSIREVILAVAKGLVDKGIVPLENSIEGTVNTTIDLLTHEVDLLIEAEIVIPIEHHLLVLPNTVDADLSKIKILVSHPQALSQCQQFCAKYLPRARIIPANSTAEAAQIVATGQFEEIMPFTKCQFCIKKNNIYYKNNVVWAAIASSRAAKTYGLKILANNICDSNANLTRFVVIGKEEPLCTGQDKTSLVFALPHQPGSLQRVLSIFATASINLTKIESRPSKQRLGEYWFLIDIEGHRLEPRVKAALENLDCLVPWYKILGSYPRSSFY